MMNDIDYGRDREKKHMDKVCIMMSTYNGEMFLPEQLDSLLGQRGVDIEIYIRDDGSTDLTRDIIKKYIGKHANIHFTDGVNLGPGRSFWELLRSVPEYDYYAFCDQDDVWMPEKLKRGVDHIKSAGNRPGLYYSRTHIVNSDMQELKSYDSDYKKRIPSFGQLIAENNASGCTMVWNDGLHSIARRLLPEHMRMHDHMLYLICQACDGYVYYDRKSYISYRQHESNVVSGRDDFCKYIASVLRYLKEDSNLANQGIELLKISRKKLDPSKRKLLKRIRWYKEEHTMESRIYLIRSGFYRQRSAVKNLMLGMMILIGRF